ncbi:MAG: sulfatase [Phycisphaerae bacterium]
MNRREFLRMLTGSAAMAAAPGLAAAAAGTQMPGRPNFLFITADDMNWDSVGVYGCKVPGITPNIDKLAAEGLRFQRAHITIAVCQPCRQVLMTGRYPHRNGGMGFYGIRQEAPTLQETLKRGGYFQGIFGKVPHLAPAGRFPWDVIVNAGQLRNGRGPELYGKATADFLAKARAAGKPFFLMANSHDPHRPFVGAGRTRKKARPGAAQEAPGASRVYQPAEVVVPAFLPDIPNVRKEVAQYFSSVRRCDETVGAVLSALAKSPLADNTLVMFLSDNGMAFPFSKTNCYLSSTRTPWICRWPGRIKPGTVDSEHFISGIDFMPTILAAAGVAPPEGMDGKSFLPLLTGGRQAGREEVFTVFHETSARKKYPMRCLQDRRFGYIYNAWADGKTAFRNESQAGLSMNAMKAAAETDKSIAARVKLFLYRVPEELYDFENDPAALKNLVDDPKHKDVLKKMRARALAVMAEKEDPLAPTFREFLGGLGA